MSKRVAFIHPVLAPYQISRYKVLGKLGDLDIHIVLESNTFKERIGWQIESIPGCKLHLANSFFVKKKVYNTKFNYREQYTKAYPYGLFQTLNNIKPHAVIFSNPTQYLFALPLLVNKNLKTGLLLEDTIASQKRKLFLVRNARKLLYRRLNFVFLFSRESEKYAEALKLKANKYRTTWSVDKNWLQIPRKKNDDPKKISFLYIGQLNERKGIMPMLQAWNSFNKSYQDVNLLLIGDGPLRKHINYFRKKNKIKNIELLGQIPYKNLKDYYISADVFILPSFEELFGLVITEAMAFGLPVLASTHIGSTELIQEGENGYLFDPLQLKTVIDSFKKIMINKNRLNKMGNKSRQIMKSRTHEIVIKQMYQDLLLEIN